MKSQANKEMIRAIDQLIEAVIGGEKITFKRLCEIKAMIDQIKSKKVV